MKLSSVEGKLLMLFCNMYTSISDKIQKEISSDGLRIMGQSGTTSDNLQTLSHLEGTVVALKFRINHKQIKQ